jgi:hypothetical protein
MLQKDARLGNRQETVKRPLKMSVESFHGMHVRRSETGMKRDTPHRLTSLIETEKGRKSRCSMCGSDDWICKVKNYVLHRICKKCGFELKEMMS